VIGSFESAASARSCAVTSCALREVISPWIRTVRASSSRSAILGWIPPMTDAIDSSRAFRDLLQPPPGPRGG
jgi:hypothetical protein